MTDADQAAKAQQEATKKHEEEARKKVAEERKAREAAGKEAATKGVEGSKPTPTQEENDLAAMGVHVVDKEPDGSDEQPSPSDQMAKSKDAKPAGGANYQTRQARPAS
jgi:hypothetical protein